jgi:peptidoglycan/xylan/chitin deacetylase (PgdA/CDA1 family)
VNRRRFLGLLGVGGITAAGGVAGGYGAGRIKEELAEDRARELSDASGPVGQTTGHGRIIWSARTDQTAVAFTFDDGPFPEFTPTVLDILKQHGIRATFNVMGFNGERHPDLLKAEVEAGHEIGNHTWTHLDLAYQTPAETLRQLRRGRQAIEDVAEVSTRFFRPPRGELTGAAARYAIQLGYDILLWSLAGDVPGFERPPDVLNHVRRGLRPGAIVAFHDGIGRGTFAPRSRGSAVLRERRQAEVKALPDVLDMALERGYRFLTVSELLALERPPTPEVKS